MQVIEDVRRLAARLQWHEMFDTTAEHDGLTHGEFADDLNDELGFAAGEDATEIYWQVYREADEMVDRVPSLRAMAKKHGRDAAMRRAFYKIAFMGA